MMRYYRPLHYSYSLQRVRGCLVVRACEDRFSIPGLTPARKFFFFKIEETCTLRNLGGVYMTPGRLSRRDEFTPVPSHGSTFVYMIPPQKVMPARVAPA